MSKLTFDTIAEAARKGLAGTVVRNCAPASIEEAKATAKKYPDIEILIKKTKHHGICVAIAPKGYHAKEAIKNGGHLSRRKNAESSIRINNDDRLSPLRTVIPNAPARSQTD